MGVYIHFGLATRLFVKKDEMRRCRIDEADLLEEMRRFYPLDSYWKSESAESFIFDAAEIILCDRFGEIFEEIRGILGEEDDEDYQALRNIAWADMTGKDMTDLAKEKRHWHFGHYRDPLPDHSKKYIFGFSFSIDHEGIVFSSEGKVLAETMGKTLGLATRYLREKLAHIPAGRFAKVLLNL
jgi:hypothetical protein